MKPTKWTGTIVAGLLILSAACSRADDTTDEITKLKKLVQDLDQKVKILERNRELESETAAAKKSDSAKLTVGQKGVIFTSADTNFTMRLGLHLQADARFFLDDHIPVNDTFLLRRVRPIFEGTVLKDFDYRLMLDFGANTATANTVQDAYVNFHHWEPFQIQVGKFKPPVGLERLQSDVNVRFIERGYPTGLVPNRDVGIQVHGTLLDGVLAYQAGIFNGVVDGGSADFDSSDDHKDYAGRIFVHPFKTTGLASVRGLGLGVAGTYGNQVGALPKYVTPGQQTFFSYMAGSGANATNVSVTAAGNHWRLVPQAYWYWGPLGVWGEYALSTQKIRRTAGASTISTIKNEAWEVSASYLLTGEENTYGSVNPRVPFSLANGSWGAWELVGRVGQLSIDQAQFPLVAATGSASKATSWGAGINWYLNQNVRLSLDYEQTQFRDGATKPGNVTAQDEKIIFSRVQVAF